MININEAVKEIREILERKREELSLTFTEEDHKYMMVDTNGEVVDTHPSVSKVTKLFYEEFDAEGIAYKKANGNVEYMKELLKEWSDSGDYASNMGSRVHYHLEKETIDRFGGFKEVRQPIFDCDIEQITKGDSMISAGKRYLNLCEKRNLVLLDTEAVLGHPELGYTGQPDKVWLSVNAAGTEIGLVITDWKTNKEKNFKTNQWTKKMYPPFHEYPSTALGHYYLQLPFYGRLLVKMLEGTKYENIKLLGCIVVLLKEDSEYEEFRVPKPVINTILDMDIKTYLDSQ
jgi:hypothetical protein